MIRTADPDDGEAILSLVRQAFSGADRDGQEEVDIVVNTWASGASLPGLELVAVQEGAVVGHVLAAVGDLAGHEVVGVAPLCVAPACRRKGVGSALMVELLHRAEAGGWPAVVLTGDPNYYERFGFGPSAPLGIFYRPVGIGSPYFQVRRLASFDASLRGEFRYCWERPAT